MPEVKPVEKVGPNVLVHGWYPAETKWLPIQVNSEGKLIPTF